MTTIKKLRLDELLVERGLVETRSKARALVLAGVVLVDGTRADKPGTFIKADAELHVKEPQKFVSRGGFKLEKALLEFEVSVSDLVCVDVGASTGGFTDCLLKSGARKVYAIDVGYGQMHWSLQSDLRVERLDRHNFRHFDLSLLKDPIDCIVVDASFISLKLLLPKMAEIFSRDQSQLSHAGIVIALVKPQFEVGPDFIGKGGIVRDTVVRDKAVSDIQAEFSKQGFGEMRICQSPITGADGNIEYLLYAQWLLIEKIQKGNSE